LESSCFNLALIAAESGIAGLEFQPEVASTNDWALSLASDEQRRWPLLVLTERQTGGRGRGANQWWSSEGALTFSLVVDAAAWGLPAERWPQIALATGLAVCETLQGLYPAGLFGLKWPNDVYLSGRKLCGILVEAPAHRGRVVIGVGINVNNSFASAPSQLQQIATSLHDIAGAEFDLNEVLIGVVRQTLVRLRALGSSETLAADFSRYCVLTGRTVQIETGRQRMAGRCQGVDEEGRLLVQTSTGLQRIVSGSVVSWD
jgi:BirA family transcriptional regulator, biotin operon repressor / biotin---[acetyl-CoA-carboxylase] ligase